MLRYLCCCYIKDKKKNKKITELQVINNTVLQNLTDINVGEVHYIPRIGPHCLQFGYKYNNDVSGCDVSHNTIENINNNILDSEEDVSCGSDYKENNWIEIQL